MLPIAINHMTLTKKRHAELLDATTQPGSGDVELCNDLTGAKIDAEFAGAA